MHVIENLRYNSNWTSSSTMQGLIVLVIFSHGIERKKTETASLKCKSALLFLSAHVTEEKHSF